MHWSSIFALQKTVRLTRMLARELTFESWYLENHPCSVDWTGVVCSGDVVWYQEYPRLPLLLHYGSH